MASKKGKSAVDKTRNIKPAKSSTKLTKNKSKSTKSKKKSNKTKNNKDAKNKMKRAKTSHHSTFLKSAPSLIALLGIPPDSGLDEKQIAQQLLELTEDEEIDLGKPNKNGTKKTKKDKKKSNKKKGKVGFADNLVSKSDDKKSQTVNINNNEIDLELLKQRAQEELQNLANENDSLYREKEELLLKYDDAKHEIDQLNDKISSFDEDSEENHNLKLIIENLKSEISTVSQETKMLRDLVNEFQANANNENNDNVNNGSSTNYDDKNKEHHNQNLSVMMDKIKQLITEKNELLTELEEYKDQIKKIKKQNTSKDKENMTLQDSIEQLTAQMAENHIKSLQENRRLEAKILNLQKKLKLSSDELLSEYEKKEQQFIQTVDEQLKYIDELEQENNQLQSHRTRQLSMDNSSGQGMFSLLKMKTQINVLGNDGLAPLNDNILAEHDAAYHNRSYSGSISFDDDDYDFMDGDMDNQFSPISMGDGETVIEHGDDVGNPLLVTMGSAMSNALLSPVNSNDGRFGSPNNEQMNDYLEMMRNRKSQKAKELASKQEQEELARKQEEQEKEKQAEAKKIMAVKQKQTALNNKVLDNMKLNLIMRMKERDKALEQTAIRSLGYFVNKNGKILPVSKEKKKKKKEDGDDDDKKDDDDDDDKKEESESEEEEEEDDTLSELLSMTIDEYTYEQLKKAITVYIFDILIKYYRFKPKQIGVIKSQKPKAKKKQIINLDYKYKTLLFSSNFNKADTVFVVVPPYRGGIAYWDLCIDKGIVYGTMLPYIEFCLKFRKKCGVILLDPKGIDSNSIPYSIFKIYDKFLSKKIKSGKIKNVIFVGGLHEGNLISHLLDRRGKELENAVKACVFLGCNDPYMIKPIALKIYQKCAANFVNFVDKNNKIKIGDDIDDTKPNGDKYIIPRKSSGIAHFCCVAAYPAVVDYIKKALS